MGRGLGLKAHKPGLSVKGLNMKSFRIASRIAAVGNLKFYKILNHYPGRTVTGVPGYACCDMYDNGLAYVRMLGIENPIYTFELSGLEVAPWDDIVGEVLTPSEIPQVAELQRVFTNKQIHDHVLDVGDPLDPDKLEKYAYYPWIRAFKPGWVSKEHMEAGVKGESIINESVTMTLVDGHDLFAVMVKVHSELYNMEKLVGQLIKSNVPYDYKTIFHYLNADPELVSGPKSSWNLKDIMDSMDSSDWYDYV